VPARVARESVEAGARGRRSERAHGRTRTDARLQIAVVGEARGVPGELAGDAHINDRHSYGIRTERVEKFAGNAPRLDPRRDVRQAKPQSYI
jgi:hypothetical protein